MSSIPTKDELLERKKSAEDRVQKAREAYDTFTKVWDELAAEEADLLKALGAHVDKTKIYSVLKTIDDLK